MEDSIWEMVSYTLKKINHKWDNGVSAKLQNKNFFLIVSNLGGQVLRINCSCDVGVSIDHECVFSIYIVILCFL